MNEFTERYKSLSNIELLEIVENQEGYQPEAVLSAKHEIEQRQISEEEHEELRKEIELNKQEKQKKEDSRKQLEDKVKKGFGFALESVNPIQNSSPTAGRLIKMIVLVFGIISVYQLYYQLDFISYMLFESDVEMDISAIEVMLPYFLLPIATILFWFRKKLGWYFIAIYLTYSLLTAFVFTYFTWTIEPDGGVFTLDFIAPKVSHTSQILMVFFYFGMLWVVVKKIVREQFNIGFKSAITTIVATIVLTVSYITVLYI